MARDGKWYSRLKSNSVICAGYVWRGIWIGPLVLCSLVVLLIACIGWGKSRGPVVAAGFFDIID